MIVFQYIVIYIYILATRYFKKKTNSSEYRDSLYYIVNMSRNSFKTPSYKLGDNDLYWIYLPDKKGAYIIPEVKLYEAGIISDNGSNVVAIIYLYPYHSKTQMEERKVKNPWLNDHLYFYDKDTDKIMKLFDSNGREPYVDNYVCPIVIKTK